MPKQGEATLDLEKRFMHLSNVSNLVYQHPALNNKLSYKATNLTHQNGFTFFQKHKD
jgi:hypothetical protein